MNAAHRPPAQHPVRRPAGQPVSALARPSPVRAGQAAAPGGLGWAPGEVEERVRIPADVEREDRLLFGLTARQLAIFAVTVLVLWAAWQATRGLVPGPVFLTASAPVAVAALAVALTRRDGLSMDRWLLAALRHARAPKRRVAAPEGVPPLPGFLDPAITRAAAAAGPAPAAADPVAVQVTGHPSGAGVIDLGRDGASTLLAVSTVNFTLRTPAEQQALVAAFAGWLNGLDAPTQILIRATRADLTGTITALDQAAATLPHPGLEATARDHAAFLADLADTRDLLHRQVLITHHHPASTVASASRSAGGAGGAAERRQGRRRDRDLHAARLLSRRSTLTARQLAGAGLAVTELPAEAAHTVLTSSCHPDTTTTPATPRSDQAGADGQAGDGATGHGVSPAVVGHDPQGLLEDFLPESSCTRRAGSIDGGEQDGGEDGGGQDPALTPAAMQVGAEWLRVGASGYRATLIVTGYPAEAGIGWLEPLLAWPGRLDVAIHLEPVAPVVAAERLRRQRARFESSTRYSAAHGHLDDPHLAAAADDARDLAQRLARGATRLFRVGIYLTVHAGSAEDLADAVAQVKALAASLLLVTQPATWRAVAGWVATLPVGVDPLKVRRTLPTEAIAAAFPFTSPDLPAADPLHPGATSPTSVLLGVNATSPGVVVWDRWGVDNHNTVVLARSGAGKSYLAKLDILRSLHHGTDVLVLDPEDEYTRLAEAVGGTVIPLGRPGVHLNPLDLPTTSPPPGRPSTASTRRGSGRGSNSGGDALARRGMFLHRLLSAALGHLDPLETAALDLAVAAAYRSRGIGTDPRTWARPAPLLVEVAQALLDPAQLSPGAAAGTAGQRLDPAVVAAAAGLAARLAPYTSGSFSGMFAGPTSVQPAGHLVVFSLRDLPEEAKTVGMLMVLDRIWRQVSDPTQLRRRLVVVDEAWLLMRQPAGADFLFRMAKAARKYWAGLTVLTQDAADVLGTDLGQAIVANATTQILLRQAPQAIDAIASAFGLSDGERHLLLAAPQGRGLLVAGGTHRVAFDALASPTEHHLATTDPAELARLATRSGPSAPARVRTSGAHAEGARSARAELNTQTRSGVNETDEDQTSFEENEDDDTGVDGTGFGGTGFDELDFADGTEAGNGDPWAGDPRVDVSDPGQNGESGSWTGDGTTSLAEALRAHRGRSQDSGGGS